MASNPLPYAARKLYDLPQQDAGSENPGSAQADRSKQELLKYVQENIIGEKKTFYSAFGTRRALYCDYTASGRSLSFIENFINAHVLPEYGNTHTTTTVTSLQTTLFRHEARDIVRNSVNASEHDAVIFTGSGCTGAVHKLINALALTQPPVVFVGPYEHHSNLLPWRDIGAHVVHIQETSDGLVNMNHLRHELKTWAGSGRQLIGAFAAASNITGTLVDVNDVSACLHRHGALVFWDYATAAPYVDIDMNPVVSGEDQPFVYKDAVFISTHKFVGGVQTPGVLVAKKKLFKSKIPHGGGGGSVFFVRKDAHRYLQETEMREEGGTPAIVESIRAGLVFQLKEAIGSTVIQSRDEQLCRKAWAKFSEMPELILLGSKTAPRLPIFSFLIKHPESGLFLHFNYVAALLNDLFGVQTRGGCACAGPYAQDLLGIEPGLAEEIESVLAEDSRLDRVHLRRYREYSDKEMLRPGFTRLNLPFFEDESAIDFVLESVRLVAKHGWKMLPQYNFNPETGEWRHRKHQVFKDRKWLGNLSYQSGELTYTQPTYASPEECPKSYQECLEIGEKLLNGAQQTKVHIGDQSAMFGDTSHLRWFLLPSEAYMWLNSPSQAAKKTKVAPPFTPTEYPKTTNDAQKTWTQCTGSGQVQSSTCIVHSVATVKEKLSATDNYYKDAPKDKPNSVESNEHQEAFQDALQTCLKEGFIGGEKTDVVTKSCDDQPCDRDSVESEELEKNTDQTFENTSGNKVCSIALQDSCSTEISEDFSSLQIDPKSEVCKPCVSATGETRTIVTASDCNGTAKQLCPDGMCPVLNNTNGTIDKTLDQKSSAEVLEKNQEPAEPLKARLWHVPPKAIFKHMSEAIKQYNMLQNGDGVLVCLSGGKDSLSLLHSLRQYQFLARRRGLHFRLGAVTIDPQTPSYDPSPLKAYLKMLDVPYFYEEQCIMDMAKNLPYEVASICSYCSRMKRGRMYTAARREGYNVLAMGQHLDDLAESFLMSMFHNGLLRTMKASYTVGEGDLRVIRPLVYVREKDLRAFAEEKHLPVIAENCPACFEEPKERDRMKQLLATQEVLHPRLFYSIMSAITPLMAIDKTGVNLNTLLGGRKVAKVPLDEGQAGGKTDS